MKLKEKEIDGKMTLVESPDAIINRISTVCQKVEKAQDSYKSIMEDVYLIHKYNLHKQAGMDFRTYMLEKTGMGKTTAHRLVAIWKSRLYAMKLVSKDNDQAKTDIEVLSGYFDKLSMRNLDFLADKDNMKAFVDGAINEGYGQLDAILDDLKRDRALAEESVKSIEDKAKKEEGSVEHTEAETNSEPDNGNPWVSFAITEESDLDELVDTLTKLYETGNTINVKYRVD